jgi:aryl-alcohol dehydrogenase-like predicted oxidoreductase
MLPLCADEKIGAISWSPLARGRLTRDWDKVTERPTS